MRDGCRLARVWESSGEPGDAGFGGAVKKVAQAMEKPRHR